MSRESEKILVKSRYSPPFYVAKSISGVYGDQLWESEWEPDQQEGIAKVLRNSSAIFVDVGAAVGVYSLMAAALGRRVIAIQPGDSIFQDLNRNMDCNSSFAPNVTLLHGFAVARNESKRKLGGYAQNSSKMTFSHEDYVLEELLREHDNLVIKMDIEGAEWPIIQDSSFIKMLKERNFILFLSLHIGFHGFDFSNLQQKMNYRKGVMSEIFTLFKLSRRFKFFYELKNGELKKVNFFRKNLFNGNAWHHNPIVISDSRDLMKSLKADLG